MSKNNCTRIGTTHSYIVRTQAGYRDLIKHYKSSWDIDEVRGTYPRKYPAMVSFTTDYEGYHYLNITAIAIETINGAIKKSTEDYLDSIKDTLKVELHKAIDCSDRVALCYEDCSISLHETKILESGYLSLEFFSSLPDGHCFSEVFQIDPSCMVEIDPHLGMTTIKDLNGIDRKLIFQKLNPLNQFNFK